MKPSIAILIPYFGKWPDWIDFFIESCRANRSIDWIIFTDCEQPQNRAPNVRFIATTFEDYRAAASERLGIELMASEPYKLCDIRPAVGHIHADVARGYDFVGFGDIDVIYGDIRAFYDDGLLGRHDLLSSHRDRVSGHLCLMRNTPEMTRAFMRAPGWKHAMRRPDYVNFDERNFFNLFRGRRILGRLGAPRARCLFREAYSTPGATSDMRWFWEGGRLTNEFYPHHPFMYLHFMSWHSNRWYGSQQGVAPGTAAPWGLLDRIVQMDWRQARKDGFMISPSGIAPIERRPYP